MKYLLLIIVSLTLLAGCQRDTTSLNICEGNVAQKDTVVASSVMVDTSKQDVFQYGCVSKNTAVGYEWGLGLLLLLSLAGNVCFLFVLRKKNEDIKREKEEKDRLRFNPNKLADRTPIRQNICCKNSASASASEGKENIQKEEQQAPNETAAEKPVILEWKISSDSVTQQKEYKYLETASDGAFYRLLDQPTKTTYFRCWKENDAWLFEFCGSLEQALANYNAVFDEACNVLNYSKGATCFTIGEPGELNENLKINKKATISLS